MSRSLVLRSGRAARAWGAVALCCALILPAGVLCSSFDAPAGSTLIDRTRLPESHDGLLQSSAGAVAGKSVHATDVALWCLDCHGAGQGGFAP